jgi:SOS response regulatory protein OraA/RecX
LDWQEFRKKLSAFLARRGFSYDTVAQVVKTSWDELQSEATILENEEFGK